MIFPQSMSFMCRIQKTESHVFLCFLIILNSRGDKNILNYQSSSALALSLHQLVLFPLNYKTTIKVLSYGKKT